MLRLDSTLQTVYYEYLGSPAESDVKNKGFRIQKHRRRFQNAAGKEVSASEDRQIAQSKLCKEPANDRA